MVNELNLFPIERNRYFYGKLLTVQDFRAEQNYEAIKRRITNRVIHGAGVVCGLGVTASDDTTLLIESGMAIDYYGRDIVVPQPLVRKLAMLEGHDKINGQNGVYLCLSYDETDILPVNAIGEDSEGGSQFNLTREGYRLYLTSEQPEYLSLLDAEGRGNTSVVYSTDDLTLVLSSQVVVASDDEFEVSVLIIKNAKTPPVRFTIAGENDFLESENGRIFMEYNESPGDTRNVLESTFRFKAQRMSDHEAQLFPNGAELNVELGTHKYKNFIRIESTVNVCSDHVRLAEQRRMSDSLEKRLSGGNLPIYLAKLELISTAGADKIFIGAVTSMPFGQETKRSGKSAAGGGLDKLSVTTSVRSLEYWQKPDARGSVSSGGDTIHFEFGIPVPEIYDFVTSHGVVDIAMPGGVKVNARYFSDEIPHGLGAGNVDIRLSVEFAAEDGGELHVFGNSEVFRHKSLKINPPWAEAAALVYPERGTMRIGVWLHDTIDGNLIRVHYYAEKPERDTKRLLEHRRIGISILPEISRIGKRSVTRFKSIVEGSEDKTVTWELKDKQGGTIDANGVYQAPEIEGTYEIIARSSADPDVTASAFIIVE